MSVLFFCVGAAKAGTSWLFDHLAAHPECHFRSIKELHYFDAIDNDRMGREFRKHRDQHQRMLNAIAETGRKPTAAQARRIADRAGWMDVLEAGVEDRDAYLAYIDADAPVIGDMTPAYALLSQERLASMAALSSDVRFLFILRDPVERLWSHVRMMAARRDDDGVASAERCGRILKRTFDGKEDQISRRSDYAGTLTKLARAVPAPKLLVEVFEEMISGEGLARICAFLGIRPIEAGMAPVHAGQQIDMTRDQRIAATHYLAPQYDAAAQALGRMPEAWTLRG